MSDNGAEGGFDPCECIWNHERAMARLLNVLRNSQALCTDTECFEPGTALPGRINLSENFYLMTFVIGIALLFYFFRPRPQVNEALNKPNRNNSYDAPPAPPMD